MATRNFWVNARIDGRKTVLSGGPQSADGGMEIEVYQRDRGRIVSAVRIKCVECDGRLATEVYTWEPINSDEYCRIATLIGGRVTKR